MHETTVIATLAAAFGLAMIRGFVATKLKMPPQPCASTSGPVAKMPSA